MQFMDNKKGKDTGSDSPPLSCDLGFFSQLTRMSGAITTKDENIDENDGYFET